MDDIYERALGDNIIETTAVKILALRKATTYAGQLDSYQLRDRTETRVLTFDPTTAHAPFSPKFAVLVHHGIVAGVGWQYHRPQEDKSFRTEGEFVIFDDGVPIGLSGFFDHVWVADAVKAVPKFTISAKDPSQISAEINLLLDNLEMVTRGEYIFPVSKVTLTEMPTVASMAGVVSSQED